MNEVTKLRMKLSRDGVQLTRAGVIEDALCLNEAEMRRTWEEGFSGKVHSKAGLGLMHNPFRVVKKKRKRASKK